MKNLSLWEFNQIVEDVIRERDGWVNTDFRNGRNNFMTTIRASNVGKSTPGTILGYSKKFKELFDRDLNTEHKKDIEHILQYFRNTHKSNTLGAAFVAPIFDRYVDRWDPDYRYIDDLRCSTISRYVSLVEQPPTSFSLRALLPGLVEEMYFPKEEIK